MSTMYTIGLLLYGFGLFLGLGLAVGEFTVSLNNHDYMGASFQDNF